MANPKKPAQKHTEHPPEADYIAEVFGDYFSKNPDTGISSRKPYRECFYLTEELLSDGALSVIRKYLLADRLAANDDGYKRYHTHYLASITPLKDDVWSPEHEPELMSEEQLTQYIRMHKLAVERPLYDNINELRQAVTDCVKDAEAFKKWQDKIRAERLKLARTKKVLFGLNTAPPATPQDAEIDSSTKHTAQDL
jgi:hypothetical protein